MEHRRLLRRITWTATVLAVVLVVFLASIIFLNPSSVGNPHFVRNINLWAVAWAINFILVLVLSFFLARNLIKLFFEYQANRPGSRIKTKLVMTLITFALFPALIMAFLAFGLINQNLRQWFSAPSEQLLDSSQVIARNYYRQSQAFWLSAAHLLARHLETGESPSAAAAEGMSEENGFRALIWFDAEGRVLWQQGAWGGGPDLAAALHQVLRGAPYFYLQRRINVDHGVVGVPVGRTGVQGALFGRFVVPESVSFHTIQVDDAFKKYEAIKGGTSELRFNYFSILAVTTLAVILGFLWLGTYIARKLTVPLEALAEGSRELAEGNLDHRVDVRAADELGILVNSFNRMAEDIKQNRHKLELANAELRHTNVRLDERRRYIETILQNIATGVISVDGSEVIRTVNEAALKMLQVSRENILNRPMREVAGADLYQEFLTLKKRGRLYGTYRKEVTFKRGERQLHVAATITSNPVPLQDEVEHLIVLDDLTELIQAEKFAAWQEVGRRLAHEIKNPLTPIQLSAERVQKRFHMIAGGAASSREIEEFRKILNDAMRIIVTEAEILRSLVEEFSRFARLPICRPDQVRVHALIEETLALYDGGLDQVQVRRAFDARIGEIPIDREQMQRVFINLIDNSLDALAENEDERLIRIITRLNAERDTITIRVEDNGSGITPEDYENLFLPYFSTKKKGTGLGLAIVRQIVSEHNGFIRAEPNQPRGTRFIMELPLR